MSTQPSAPVRFATRAIAARPIGRRAIAVLAAAALLAACGSGPAASPTGAANPTEPAGSAAAASPAAEASVAPRGVKVALNWLPGSDAAPWFSAVEQGFFTARGLDVTIERGFGSGDTVKRVATGEVQVGIADLSALVPARINDGIDVVSVATIGVSPTQAIFVFEDSGITTPKDLEGRTISCSNNNATMLAFPLLASAQGIDASTIEWKLGESSAIIPSFLAGRVDAACTSLNSTPEITAIAPKPVRALGYAEWGVEGYGTQILVARETIERDPELVRDVAAGLLEGLEFAVQQPEAAVDLLVARVPELDRDGTLASWKIDIESRVNDDTATHGFGYIDPELFATSYRNLVTVLGLDASAADPASAYTTEFFPGAP